MDNSFIELVLSSAGCVPPLARVPGAEADPARSVAAAQDEDLLRVRAARPPSRVGRRADLARGLPRRQQIQRQGW